MIYVMMVLLMIGQPLFAIGEGIPERLPTFDEIDYYHSSPRMENHVTGEIVFFRDIPDKKFREFLPQQWNLLSLFDTYLEKGFSHREAFFKAWSDYIDLVVESKAASNAK